MRRVSRQGVVMFLLGGAAMACMQCLGAVRVYANHDVPAGGNILGLWQALQ
jgi:hypothetical protein